MDNTSGLAGGYEHGFVNTVMDQFYDNPHGLSWEIEYLCVQLENKSEPFKDYGEPEYVITFTPANRMLKDDDSGYAKG